MTGKKVNRLIVPNVYTANGVEPVTSVNNILPVNGNVTIPIPTVPTNVSAFYNDAGYLTSATLDEYATQSWVQQQGYLTSVPSQYITDTELSITLADYVTSTNLTTILDDYATKQWATEQASSLYTSIQGWVNNQGYTVSADLANVATTGDYDDLLNKPTIPQAQIQSDWNQTDSSAVDFIKNKPTIPSGVIVDQVYDGTSTNAQSGVAIEGELSTNYQPKLVSGTNIKTINHTSLLGSGNINVLRNTATGSNSITILGTATSSAEATNIGYGSAASTYATALGRQATASSNATAIGYRAIASGYYSTALGHGTSASGKYAIQIGSGINSTASSLQIGFGASNNYTLLDGTTGLIPDARISTNIARVSQIPTMTSQLTNNSGFITNADLPTNYVTTDTAQSISGQKTFTDTIKSSVNNSLALTLSTGDAFGVTVKRTDANNEIKFGIGQGGDNRGIWDVRHNKWAFNVTNDGKSYTLGKEIAVKSDLNNLANKDLSNLSTTGQAIIDGKADTTLSNVSSIDSSSAVATALNTKVNNDNYYYKSGDTDSYTWYGGGYITSGGTEIWFTLPTPKSMANVTTVTCTALTTAFRKSNGGYMPSSGGNGWNAKANATVTISKQTENALSVNVKYDKWGGTNNTPVGVLASISLSFT